MAGWTSPSGRADMTVSHYTSGVACVMSLSARLNPQAIYISNPCLGTERQEQLLDSEVCEMYLMSEYVLCSYKSKGRRQNSHQ